MNKCIFFDRDGVINKDKVDYVYTLEEFKILPGVLEAFNKFKADGYKLIVITNQSGIAKGIFTMDDVDNCHNYLQEISNNAIDDFYISPYHESKSSSLTRKPGSLMWEKAIAKHNIDVTKSIMIGDKARDLEPAKKLGIKTIQVIEETEKYPEADAHVMSLLEAYDIVKSFKLS